MSDEEQSDSEFYYPEQQKNGRERLVAAVGILTKLNQADRYEKLVPVVVDFRNKKCDIINYLLTSTV